MFFSFELYSFHVIIGEFLELVVEMQGLIGRRFGQVRFNQKACQISLESDFGFGWLTFNFSPLPSYGFWSEDRGVPLIKPEKKPLSLFMNRHFKGAVLKTVRHREDEGRACDLIFEKIEKGVATELRLQVFLYPGGQNMGAQVGGKVVWARKPRMSQLSTAEQRAFTQKECRPQSFFVNRWKTVFGSKNEGKAKDRDEKVWSQQLKKKKKGLENILNSLDSKKVRLQALQNLSNLLKLTSGAVPEMSTLSDQDKKILEACPSDLYPLDFVYSEMKRLRKKILGTSDRAQSVTAEILEMEQRKYPEKPNPLPSSLFEKAGAKGRTKILGPGLRLYMGRSGKENLALLRKAKPWYLWLHLRDFPGTHGILEKPRSMSQVPVEVLRQAAQWVGEKSLKKGLPGGKYEVLYTECRHVRPIKGAKAGQVTHSHEKVLGVLIP